MGISPAFVIVPAVVWVAVAAFWFVATAPNDAKDITACTFARAMLWPLVVVRAVAVEMLGIIRRG